MVAVLLESDYNEVDFTGGGGGVLTRVMSM